MSRAWLKRAIFWAAWAAVVFGVLALASWVTTAYHWDGGFPAAEIRIHVFDAAGRPVRGAVLHTRPRKPRKPQAESPLHEAAPTTDADGLMACHQVHAGLQWGGLSWNLFWFIPMGARAPQWDCEITARGYRPLQFDVRRLFDSRNETSRYTKFHVKERDVEEREVQMLVYEHQFTLQREAP